MVTKITETIFFFNKNDIILCYHMTRTGPRAISLETIRKEVPYRPL